MRKTIIGIVVGGAIVLLVNLAIEWWQDWNLAKVTAAMQTADPAEWYDLKHFSVDGVPPGEVPTAHIRYEVLKPLGVRISISPRNLETGESVCAGRISSIYPEPRAPIAISIPVSTLAGLQSCEFPPGDYAISVTIIVTDRDQNVQLKPIVVDKTFTVAKKASESQPTPYLPRKDEAYEPF